MASVDGATAQGVPADFELFAAAGNIPTSLGYSTLKLDAAGNAVYRDYVSLVPYSDDFSESQFVLSADEMAMLWQEIQDRGVLTLDGEYGNPDIAGGTTATLRITADGSTTLVRTRTIPVDPFDGVMTVLNGLTPGDADLHYDATGAFEFSQIDVCGLPSKRAPTDLLAPEAKLATVQSSTLSTATPGDLPKGYAHPASYVAYRMPLQEAVEKGIATLYSKGEGAYGDKVSIFVDNRVPQSTSSVEMSLFLDLYGEHVTPAHADGIRGWIHHYWQGKTTSSGDTVNLTVHANAHPGVTEPPNTLGFHQIEMVDDDSGFWSVPDFPAGSGHWQLNGYGEEYAHAAGLLLGLPTRYHSYTKQGNGNWKRDLDEQEFTSTELANEIPSEGKSFLEAVEWLDEMEPGEGFTWRMFGDDLMSHVHEESNVRQSDIETLVANAGLIIEVRPGDVLVSKSGQFQNFTISRARDLYLSPGETHFFEGLWVVCLDKDRIAADYEHVFDVGPSLSQWQGVKGAPYLQQLLEYLDRERQYCELSHFWNQIVWRITDNQGVHGGLDPWLNDAGFTLGAEILDFPDLRSPNEDDAATTALVTPHALFVPEVVSAAGTILVPGQTVDLDAALHAPLGKNPVGTASWRLLNRPVGSQAELTAADGERTSFTADVRGIYRIELEMEVTDQPGSAFSVRTEERFVAEDDRVETFESGLAFGGKFDFESYLENPLELEELGWFGVAGGASTGDVSAVSAPILSNRVATLTIGFDQAEVGVISFAYRVDTEDDDYLGFFVDGTELFWAAGEDTGWEIVEFELEPGRHRAEWKYIKDGPGLPPDAVWIDDVVFPQSAVAIAIEENSVEAPSAFHLDQNYPNPFNPQTTIRYELPAPSTVAIMVLDALGRTVRRITLGTLQPGEHEVKIEAAELPSGVYFYRLVAGDYVETKRMIVVR